MKTRRNMREFVNRHSQLQHVSGITYALKRDPYHGPQVEVCISRDIMRKAGWAVGTLVDVEWDKCRLYLVCKPAGMYKIRFSHSSYECHPEAKQAGRFVGRLRFAWYPATKLPDTGPKRAWCSDIRVGRKGREVSCALPRKGRCSQCR